jgi:nucleoid DNA-binding protein
MHKQEFIKHLAKKNRRPQKFYQEALTEILHGLQEHLAQGKEVVLTGFGTFYTRSRKGGTVMSVRTKKKVAYKPFKQAAFKQRSGQANCSNKRCVRKRAYFAKCFQGEVAE